MKLLTSFLHAIVIRAKDFFLYGLNGVLDIAVPLVVMCIGTMIVATIFRGFYLVWFK